MVQDEEVMFPVRGDTLGLLRRRSQKSVKDLAIAAGAEPRWVRQVESSDEPARVPISQARAFADAVDANLAVLLLPADQVSKMLVEEQAEEVLCPDCGHGIDEHNIDGGWCHVDVNTSRQCQCNLKPSEIANAALDAYRTENRYLKIDAALLQEALDNIQLRRTSRVTSAKFATQTGSSNTEGDDTVMLPVRGDTVAFLRGRAGLTHEALASKSGVQASWVIGAETDNEIPTPTTFQAASAIAAELGVGLSVLFLAPEKLHGTKPTRREHE